MINFLPSAFKIKDYKEYFNMENDMNNIVKFCKKNATYLIIGAAVLLAAVMLIVVLSGKNNDDGKSNTIMNNTSSSESSSSETKPSDSTTTENTEDATSQTEEPTTETQPNEDEVGDVLDDETTSETTTSGTTSSKKYKYSIRVNTYTNCITIYAKDENGKYTVPYKAMACSTGRGNNTTKTGTWNTTAMYKWCRMVDWTYGQYAYRIHGAIMFHSTPIALNLTLPEGSTTPKPTYSKGRVEVEEFNKLGTAASLGCVRLTVADAKWLYDNCAVGTKTVIVSEPTDPLPKPEVIKIPENIPAECGGYVTTLMPENHKVKPINWVYKTIYVAWDPTDPDPNNPWNKYSATISAPAMITLEAGSSDSDIVNQITAKDTCGNIINEKVKIKGTYDLDTIGSYTITLSVTDALGRSDSKNVTLVITEPETTAPGSEETPDGDNTPDSDITPDGDDTADSDITPDGDDTSDSDITPDGDNTSSDNTEENAASETTV